MIKSLKELKRSWRSCERCGLCETRKRIVFADGPADANIMIVGAAPSGEDESASPARPFQGKIGGMLEWVCEQAKVDITEAFLTNLTMCVPPENRDPSKAEIAACRPRLLEAIRLVDPNIIIASGRLPSQVLTGQRTLSVLKRRGELIDCSFEGSYGNYSVPVLVTIAPALLLRNPDVDGGILSATVEDFRLAWEINNRLEKEWKSYG